MPTGKKNKEKLTRNNGQWTEGRVRSFVTSTIRGGFRRWAPKYNVLKSAFAGRKINQKSGREANHYVCGKCGEHFPQSGIQVDHISPVVDPDIGFVNWDTFIERLFCEADNLQVLCKGCHKVKSKEERETSVAGREKRGTKNKNKKES